MIHNMRPGVARALIAVEARMAGPPAEGPGGEGGGSGEGWVGIKVVVGI